MSKMLKYDLEKNFRLILILSALAMAFFISFFSLTDLVREFDNGNKGVNISLVSDISLVFSIAAVIVPFYVLSFKMSKVKVDQLYSLPIKRRSLYLEKYLLGLIILFVPFLLAILSSTITVSLRENAYDGLYHVISYFFGYSVVLVTLYSISAFLFTRCNRIVDGVLMVIGFLLIPLLVDATLFNIYRGTDNEGMYKFVRGLDSINIYLSIREINSFFNTLINFNGLEGGLEIHFSLIYGFGLNLGFGILGAIGYFILNPRDKAYRVGEISRSSFAYKLFIPLYSLLFGLYIIPTIDNFFLYIIFIGLIYLANVIYLNNIRKMDRIYLYSYGAFIAGIIINLLLLNIL